MASSKARGFSMVEMAVVLSIGMVMMAITFISLQPALKDARVNQAYAIVLSQMRNARAKAVENREQYIVCFGASGTPTGASTAPYGAPTAQSIQVFQWPSGASLSTAIQISRIDMPSDVSFQTVSGLPSTAPDGFGGGTVALDFDQSVGSAIKNQVMFIPDGSARDTNGNLNSGILYMARTGELYSTRSITVWAASGRIRGWRLSNASATYPWVQQ